MALILWIIVGIFIGVAIGMAEFERRQIQIQQAKLQADLDAVKKEIAETKAVRDAEVFAKLFDVEV